MSHRMSFCFASPTVGVCDMFCTYLRPPYWTLQVSEVMGLGAELASGGVHGRQTPTKRGGPPPGLSRP